MLALEKRVNLLIKVSYCSRPNYQVRMRVCCTDCEFAFYSFKVISCAVGASSLKSQAPALIELQQANRYEENCVQSMTKILYQGALGGINWNKICLSSSVSLRWRAIRVLLKYSKINLSVLHLIVCLRHLPSAHINSISQLLVSTSLLVL